jgi:hypothetical protein
MAFAEMTAQRLRAEGDAAAAGITKSMQKVRICIILKKLDSFKASLRENTTFILNTIWNSSTSG